MAKISKLSEFVKTSAPEGTNCKPEDLLNRKVTITGIKKEHAYDTDGLVISGMMGKLKFACFFGHEAIKTQFADVMKKKKIPAMEAKLVERQSNKNKGYKYYIFTDA